MKKPRKPLKRVSAKRAGEVSRHPKVRKAFLDVTTICFRCGHYVPRDQRTLHHWAGRTMGLLNWTPGFRMADRVCHDWIEKHRNESVKLGYRAPDNIFGRPSKLVIT